MSEPAANAVPMDTDSMYANVFSFLGLPLSRDLARPELDAVVLGVPYDLGTSGRPGARSGPAAIRQASSNLRWEEARWPWGFALAERLGAIDYGDLMFATGDSDDMLAVAENTAAEIAAAGKTLVSLGGDHFATLPLLRGVSREHGRLALIHFDAHTDTYDEGEKYNHGCMFHRAPREGLVNPERSIQLGIRTEYEPATHDYLVIDAHRAHNQTPQATAESIRDRVGDSPAYLTFDIDCLDPAFAPGTGTPVVGGMSSSWALQVLQGIAGLNIVAFDVMEVAPAYDHAQVTSLAAATLAQQFLYMRASRG